MRQIPIVLAFSLAVPAAMAAQKMPTDPFRWLEDVESKRSMNWVHARNAATEAVLAKSPLYQPIFDRVKKILDSKDKIAYPRIIGDMIFNFWQDAEHERGIWRRTTWSDYLSGAPTWETMIDVDALSRAEGVTWSFGGANCLEPENQRCLVSLARGGSDARQIREFDLETKQFVKDGISLPEAKSSVAWIDRNTLLVGTNFGVGSMTTSGYPRIIKRWTRGTPLASAETVLAVPASHVSANASSYDAGGRRYVRVTDGKTFYTSVDYLYENGQLRKLDRPEDSDVYLLRDQMIVYVRDPWTVRGRTWSTGSLVAMNAADFLDGKRDFALMMQPGPRETIRGISSTQDYVLIEVLSNVQAELRRYHRVNGEWTYDKVPAPTLGDIGVDASAPTTNRFFFDFTNFIQPTTVYVGREDGTVAEVKRLPAEFDATGLRVEQREATSKDGTKIPFFIVRREGLALDGTNPTLLHAYGGFEVSLAPSYAGTEGAVWLERGGVYVLANIRGGGEFGPQWHRAGLKEHRQRIYDDFTAVAEALIRQRVTSPARLGIMGGSNGGLLMGVALTQRPDLYNAIVIQNPLLDMQRYSHLLAGASWMGEYGDPDKPEEWSYISRYSPYQNLKAGTKYPTVLFTTTTRDDRVHPAHARKMAAKMESMGIPFYFFENTEGGHGAGVTSDQRAKAVALTYSYLWRQLGGSLTP